MTDFRVYTERYGPALGLYHCNGTRYALTIDAEMRTRLNQGPPTSAKAFRGVYRVS